MNELIAKKYRELCHLTDKYIVSTRNIDQAHFSHAAHGEISKHCTIAQNWAPPLLNKTNSISALSYKTIEFLNNPG